MLPDSQHHKPDTAYFLELVEKTNKSLFWLSKRLGVGYSRMKYLAIGERVTSGKKYPVKMNYVEQYALEQLAKSPEKL